MEDQNVYKKDANNVKNYRIKGFSQNLDEVTCNFVLFALIYDCV